MTYRSATKCARLQLILTKEPLTDLSRQAEEVYVFREKILGKSRFTRGIFILLNGISAEACDIIKRGNPLPLMAGVEFRRRIFGMISPIQIVAKTPQQCHPTEIADLGGEVSKQGLDSRVRSAAYLIFLKLGCCLSGVAALKHPILFIGRKFRLAQVSTCQRQISRTNWAGCL